jgi:hypothetical protein
MGIFFGWVIFSIVVGFVGSNRNIGFWGAFFLSILLSPVIGLIIALVSKNKRDERYQQLVLRAQRAQKVALEKLSDEKTIKQSSISIADELEKLQKLKEKKIISETEYTKIKDRLIDSSSIPHDKTNDDSKIETGAENIDLIDPVDVNEDYEICINSLNEEERKNACVFLDQGIQENEKLVINRISRIIKKYYLNDGDTINENEWLIIIS